MSGALPSLTVRTVRGASRVATFVARLPGARESQRVESPGGAVALLVCAESPSRWCQGSPLGRVLIPAGSPEAVEREAARAVAEALQRA